MGILAKHKFLETNATALLVGSFLVVTIGGIVEIAPLFYLENTIENVEGMRPYSPLELAGRNIYIREGCYVCHSQMIRPMRDEFERYGHYSLAAESMYDHPFQWGSKRTGPDLARVGGRYSDAWHVDHLINPQSVVPVSIMPKYGFLLDRLIEPDQIGDIMATNAHGRRPLYRGDAGQRRGRFPRPGRSRWATRRGFSNAIPRRRSATSTASPACRRWTR